MRRFFSISRIYNVFSAFEQKLFVILVCLGAVGLAGIMGDAYRHFTETIPASGGELVEGVLGQPTNLHPLLPGLTDADQDIRVLIHASLYRLDANGDLEPYLAESLPEISDDLKTYTVRLRKDIKWQDGQSITSSDVVHTIKTIQDRNTGSHLRNSFRFVTAESLDEHTVRFHLHDPSVTFPKNLLIGLIPAHISQYDPMQPIGAGPYLISKYRYRGDGRFLSVELIRNEQFSLKKPLIEKITLKFYDTSQELHKAYKQGQITSFATLPSNEPTEKVEHGHSLTISLPQYQAVFINLEKNEALKNVKVRQALHLATNRIQIVNDVYGGQAKPIDGPLIKTNETAQQKFDLEMAKALLEEEGWQIGENGIRYKDSKPLALTLTTSDTEFNVAVTSTLIEQWRNLGVNVVARILPSDEVINRVLPARDYETLLLFENNGHDPDPYPFWHSSQTASPGLNLSMLRNQELDKIIVEARTTADKNAREQLYTRFAELMNQEMPAIYLIQPHLIYWFNTDIKNINLDHVVIPNERFTHISDWYIKTARVWK